MISFSTPKGYLYLIDTIERVEGLQLFTHNRMFHIKNQELVVNFEKTQIVLKNPDRTFEKNLGTIGRVTIIGYHPDTEYTDVLNKLIRHKKWINQKELVITDTTLILRQDDREYPYLRPPKTENP